jgi:hypothetical protein
LHECGHYALEQNDAIRLVRGQNQLAVLVPRSDQEVVLVLADLLVDRERYLDALEAIRITALAEDIDAARAAFHRKRRIHLADPLVDLSEQRSSLSVVANGGLPRLEE